MADHLNWGILGTGYIANKFALSVAQSSKGTVVAVGSRNQETANIFAEKHSIRNAYSSYEALLKDENVEVVYISTPNPFHAEWAIKTAKAGKHILCEKPIGLNHSEAMGILEEANLNGVFLMEAYMYRCHPLIARLIEMIQQEVIGSIKSMRLDFSFYSPLDPKSRLYNLNLAGGGILDVGGYPVSLARLIAGVSQNKDFADPIQVQGMGQLGSTGIDEFAIANLKFEGDLFAQVSCGVHHQQDWDVQLFGSKGSIQFKNPWVQDPRIGITTIRIEKNGKLESEENIHFDRLMWSYEVDKVSECIGAPEKIFPAMSSADTLGNMKAMDAWRKDLGLIFPSEKKPPILSGEPLNPGRIEQLPTLPFGDSDKKVSRLVMGVDNQLTLSHASVMFDDFIERGGTAFDTAWIYNQGFPEGLWGNWQKARGIREQVFLIGKGGHTPYNNPDAIAAQLNDSLRRLKTDYIDLYYLHRDNLEYPVGDFIHALNRFKNEGKIRALGASNWSLNRIAEANAYALENGLAGFTAVSNQFSLAEMVKPPWPGCISSSDSESRNWFKQKQIPLFCWSSQARGFFTNRSNPQNIEDKELVRCWYNKENFERKDRAQTLAKEKGTSVISIALAYVLNQPFQIFSLIGPRTLEETRTSCPGAYIQLNSEELKWLNLES